MNSAKFKTCYLHIGAPKTGTSSIQGTLNRNRERLAELGVFYPSVTNHHYISKAFGEIKVTPFLARKGFEDPDAIADHNRALLQGFVDQAAQTDCDTLVISSEYLSILSDEECGELAEFLRGLAETTVVICYLRDPLSSLGSAIQQGVKSGRYTLAKAIERKKPYRAGEKLPHYVKHFGQENLWLRVFDRRVLFHNDVVADFLSVLGIPENQIATFDIAQRNESMSHEFILIADAMVRLFPSLVDGRWNRMKARELSLGDIDGPRFAAPKAALQRAEMLGRETVAYLKDQFGLVFPERSVTARAADDRVFSQEAIDSIATKLNDLVLTIERQEGELAFLKGFVHELKQDPKSAAVKYRHALKRIPGHRKARRGLKRVKSVSEK